MSEGKDCDVVIAGGGLIGLSLAVALGGAGLEVAVVDRERRETKLSQEFDGRSSAIARGSQQALATLGIWDEVGGDAQPIRDIRVTDGRPGEPASPFFLHYAEADLGEGPMGWIVENRVLRAALHRRLDALAGVSLLSPASVAAAEVVDGRQRVRLADGRELRAPLLVAADGKDSRLRENAGIRVWRWHYPQTGLVATLAHELPHDAVAHEHFLPSGPFAVLPMTDGDDGQNNSSGGGTAHRSSLVWTEKNASAPAFLTLDADGFGHAMERRFGLSLGRLRPIGRRFAYPLDYMLAETFAAPRLALLGDAAHVIHPIAGQGLNLGLRDVAALAEAVVDHARLGLDPGDAVALERYQRWRRFDTLVLGVVTDGLNRLFSNDSAPLRLVRDLGLATVNRAKPLKRLFMKHAMGLVGELPRLVRGEAL
jgi:2-octaprenyl-6-methoxyphenol hydroxylase